MLKKNWVFVLMSFMVIATTFPSSIIFAQKIDGLVGVSGMDQDEITNFSVVVEILLNESPELKKVLKNQTILIFKDDPEAWIKAMNIKQQQKGQALIGEDTMKQLIPAPYFSIVDESEKNNPVFNIIYNKNKFSLDRWDMGSIMGTLGDSLEQIYTSVYDPKFNKKEIKQTPLLNLERQRDSMIRLIALLQKISTKFAPIQDKTGAIQRLVRSLKERNIPIFQEHKKLLEKQIDQITKKTKKTSLLPTEHISEKVITVIEPGNPNRYDGSKAAVLQGL